MFSIMKEIRLLKASEIECRVGQCGKSQKGVVWCSLLLYKDARCDQRILDETFGMFGWQRRHEVINGQLCCTVAVQNPETGEWVSKQDVGVESNTEAVKGSFSDAFKRASFNWGVGRELYTAPKIFITLGEEEWIEKNGKPSLSPKCVFTVSEIGYDDARNINVLTIVDKNGNVRFKIGQAQAIVGDSGMTFQEQLEGFIKPALGQARTEDDVKKIWDEYTSYQNNPDFVAAVSGRLGEIRNAA